MRSGWISAIALIILVPATFTKAWGDGVCNQGYRDTTAGERAHMTRILETVKKALPPAPQGWVIAGDEQVSVPQSLCMDFERKPWPYEFSREYRRIDNLEERDAAIQSAADAWKADMAAKQPRLDAIQAKGEALTKQQIAFVEKGEMAKAIALNEQMAVVQEEYKRIFDEGDVQERNEATLNAAERDMSMWVRVAVNPWGESPPGEGATSIPSPTGAGSAYRWSVADTKVPEDRALYLFGQWRPTPQGGFWLVARGNVPANLVHSMSLHVSADPGRIDAMLAAVDFAGLASVVER